MVNLKNQVESVIPDVAPKYRDHIVWLQNINAMSGAMVGFGGGAPTNAESNSSGIGGARFQATTDDFAFPVLFARDVDVERPIAVSLIWSSDQTSTADDYVFAVNYIELTLNTTAMGVPATAIGTQIPSDANVATAHAVQQTAWGEITAGTLSGTFEDGYMHGFEVDPTTAEGDPTSDIVILYAVVFRYSPKTI